MRLLASIYLVTLLLAFTSNCQSKKASIQKTIFEPGHISTQLVEYSVTFSPSGTEVYFARSNDQWGKRGMKSSIYFATKRNQKWSKPELASFSGQYDDSAPYLTDGGKTLYFISKIPHKEVQQVSMDIWKVERLYNEEWGTPVRLDDPINSPQNEYCLRADKYGNLYFASDRNGGYGQGDLYKVEKTGDMYGSPVNFGKALNSATGEWNLEVSENGNVIIFEASGRPENFSPYGDLFISFKSNDTWSIPQNIVEINTTGSDLYPEIIEDQNIIYFTSSDSIKSLQTNIYSVSYSDILDKYKRSAVFKVQ